MKLGAKEKVDKTGFAKVFEKEFIPEFSDKVFDIIYDYNKRRGRKGKKGKKQNKNLLGVGGDDAKDDSKNDAKDDAKNEEKADDAKAEEAKAAEQEEKKISRLDCQRFIKSAKEVRKHIREKSLVPLSSIFSKTEFSDISTSVNKVTFEEFKSVFEKKLGKKQCEDAFNLMKDDKGEVSIVAYNNFRDKGVQKLLGDAGDESKDDAEDATGDGAADGAADATEETTEDAPEEADK